MERPAPFVKVQITQHAIDRYRAMMPHATKLTDDAIETEIHEAAADLVGIARVSAKYPGRERWRARQRLGKPWSRIYLWIERGVVMDVQPAHGKHEAIVAARRAGDAVAEQLAQTAARAREEQIGAAPENRQHPGARRVPGPGPRPTRKR